MYKKLASNTVAQVISKVGTALLSIVLIWFLTKYLSVENYGIYNKVYNYLGIFAFLADLGLYTIAIREISRGDISEEKVIGNILSLRVLLGTIMGIFAFLWACFLPWYNSLLILSGIAIIALFTLVSLINSSLLALMQAKMQMEFSLFSLLWGKIMTLLLIITIFLFFTQNIGNNMSLLAVFTAGFIGICATTYANYLYAKKMVSIRFLWDKEYMRHIFFTSLPYALALFLSVLYFKVDMILLSLIEIPEKANISLALYGLPMKIVEVLMVFSWFYLNSLLPHLSKKWKEKNISEMEKFFWISLKFMTSTALLIFICGSILATQIITLIATPEYIFPTLHSYSSVDAFHIALWVLIFYFPAMCCIYLLIASEKQSLLLKINIVIALINIIWNILFIPKYSFYGASFVTLVSQILLFLVTYITITKYYHIERKYIYAMGKSFFLAGGVYYMWYALLPFLWNLHALLQIVIGWGCMTMIYLWGEYVLSKKLLSEFRTKKP